MSENKESTANSITFAPMPIAALLANLMPLKNATDSHESSFAFGDETDESETSFVGNEPEVSSSRNKINKDNFTPTVKQSKDIKPCASERKEVVYRDHDKENFHNSLGSKQPCSVINPSLQSAQKDLQSTKEKPILTSAPNYAIQNRDRVRCELFAHNQPEEELPVPHPQQESVEPRPVMPPPAPETPLNRKLMPMSCVATPSYPQGNMSNNSSKVLFKTTCIKDKKYMFIKKLGMGGSSEVYKVLEIGTSNEYAVKCVYLAKDRELAQSYINEVRLLRELQKSDRVVKLYDYEYDRSSQLLRIVLEVGETDLSSILKARGSGLPPGLLLHYWEEMLQAVHFIHEHGVIHADLKPANFLLVCGQLKLIDFGIASAISSDATSVVRAQAAGTYSYISPEALMGGAGGYGVTNGDGSAPIKISFRSDVWSLGCILYSMVYGRTPFSHIPNLAKLAAILDPKHRIDYPPVEHVPPSLIAALKWCLTYNARARPSVRELLAIHLQQARTPLPQTLLDKLRPIVTPEEFELLLRAQV